VSPKRGAAHQAQGNAVAGVAVIGSRRFGVRPSVIRAAVRAALKAGAPHVRGDVTVVLTGDGEIRSLNRRYRGKDRPTDVLAFEIGEGTSEREPFGDVVISVATANRQAHAYRAPLEEELRRLAVHGVLHLCGYDHHTKRDAARMFSLARRIMANGRGKAR
jgi:probable rRNA maturation factor